MGVPVTTPGSNRDNCPKISTSCVIWQGPNIPCINLCAGDSIDEVVFKLATLLCDVTENVLDITTLEFACFIQAGVEEPQTLKQLLQLIINKICTLEATSGSTGNQNPEGNNDPNQTRTGGSDTYVELPPCLYFTNDDGDLVTSMVLTEYVLYLANVVCTIILDINTVTNSITQINNRVNTLELQVSNLQEYTYEIFVTSQCASAPTSGQTILIQEAFANLEASFCNLQSSVGLSTELIAAINNQCPSLSSSQQLSNPPLLMSDLSGWINTPITAADSINNLWLTLCDMRSKLVNYFSLPPVLPCVLIVPENVTALTIGTSYSTITWEAPSYSGVELPTGYRIEVFEWTGTAPTGPSLFDSTYSGTTFSANISGASIVVGTEYVVYVHSIYSCGESNGAALITELLVPTVLFKVNVIEKNVASTTVYCNESGSPVTYTAKNKVTTVELQNFSTGLPVINGYAYSIDVTLRYAITSCSYFGTAYIDVVVPILPGNSSADYTYETETWVNCGTALCTAEFTVISCGVSIDDANTVFDTASITLCV
jgi:hypothetical protein